MSTIPTPPDHASAIGNSSVPHSVRNPLRASWGRPTERPLTAKIFWVSLVMGIAWAVLFVPAFKLFMLVLQHRDWSAGGRSFSEVVWSIGGEASLFEMKLTGIAGLLVSLIPMFFAVLHGQTIELLHKTLHAQETNPPLWLEGTKKRASWWYLPYGLFRNRKWFQGLLSGPTLGAFLRIAFLPFPAVYDESKHNKQWVWWARHCPGIAGAGLLIMSVMWAAETGSFSVFNGALLACVILFSVLALWPWVWIGIKLARRKFVKMNGVEGKATSPDVVPVSILPARWVPIYEWWLRRCPIIFAVLTAILVLAILDATRVLVFPKWPVWVLVFSIALLPWTWLALRIVGRMLNVPRLNRRAQLLIEVNHLMKGAKPAETRNAYVQRALILESQTATSGPCKLPPIPCESLFELYQANENKEIQIYFETQESLPPLTVPGWLYFVRNWLFYIKRDEKQQELDAEKQKAAEHKLEKEDLPQFLCPVKIKLGFLCPTYLVSGLLTEFDEDWKKIVRSYGLDMASLSTDDPLRDWPELRKLQVFIWDCWIQWGPSVPVCRSMKWTEGKIGVQYGYGDENNSIPMTYVPLKSQKAGARPTVVDPVGNPLAAQEVADVPSTWKDWEFLFRKFQKEGALGRSELPFVIPAEVEANLRWIGGESLHEFCRAQERKDAWLSLEAREITPKWDSPKMYSAYVWVIIAICVRDTSNSNSDNLMFKFDREHADQDEPWRGLIPFFQHGNVAEESVYLDIKDELAAKTVETLMTILEKDHRKGGRKIEFSYVCAYDDNGDPSANDARSSEPLGGHPSESIRKMMEDSLNRYGVRFAENKEALEAIKGRIHLNHDAIASISACDLPVIAERYLESIKNNVDVEAVVEDEDLVDIRFSGIGQSYVHLLRKIHDGLYAQSFPDERERETYEQHHDRLFGEGRSRAPEIHCVVRGKNLADPDKCIIQGFLFLEWYPKSRCGLFSYLAVSPGFRDRGIAQNLIQRGLEIFEVCNGGQPPLAVFAETEKPGMLSPATSDSQPRMHEADRIRVLHKLGAIRVPLNSYVQPALDKDKETVSHLTLLTFSPTPRKRAEDRPAHTDLSATLVLQYLEEFYRSLEITDPNDDSRFKAMQNDFQRMQQELSERVGGQLPLPEEEYGMPYANLIA